MVQYQLKLRPTKGQARMLEQWLFHLASVYNFAIRKIELNTTDKIYFQKQDFQNLLAGHSEKLGIPSHTLQGVLCVAFDAWKRCVKKPGNTLIAWAGCAHEVAYAEA
jgi:putative transposase